MSDRFSLEAEWEIDMNNARRTQSPAVREWASMPAVVG